MLKGLHRNTRGCLGYTERGRNTSTRWAAQDTCLRNTFSHRIWNISMTAFLGKAARRAATAALACSARKLNEERCRGQAADGTWKLDGAKPR